MADSPAQQRLARLQTIVTAARSNPTPPPAPPATPHPESSPASTPKPTPTPIASSTAGSSLYHLQQQIQGQNQTIQTLEGALAQLRDHLVSLQADFESEEKTTQALNSSFAKSFAQKVEERFGKVEVLLSSHKDQLALFQSTATQQLKALEGRLNTATTRLEQEQAERRQQAAEHQKRLDALTAIVETLRLQIPDVKAATERQQTLVREIATKELTAVHDQIDQEIATTRARTAEYVHQMEEGIAFIRDGKSEWLRMFEYKLAPFKLRHEEQAKAIEDLGAQIADLGGRLDQFNTGLTAAISQREEDQKQVMHIMQQERKIREHTEDQITILLEKMVVPPGEAVGGAQATPAVAVSPAVPKSANSPTLAALRPPSRPTSARTPMRRGAEGVVIPKLPTSGALAPPAPPAASARTEESGEPFATS
ncbi:hypothetical protein PAPYR_238 [Paratrimastix pyriformis]|uniref:SWI5-dependent HO expression protein 3 n=1 Tax=Paratrimastix pyriformis TaxID=342808 RepID=A0ABQ8UV79_9EUKA|nr:hypothetical protein PAPYR_238 [Paratrimastix pyriformis]